MSNVVACIGLRPGEHLAGDPNTFEALVGLAYGWLLDEQPDTVITSLSLGWGQAFAAAALEHGIPVHAYIAHLGLGDKWAKRDNERYSSLILRCKINLLHPAVPANEEAASKLLAQCHEVMIDDCDKLVALWDGKPGSETARCIGYATDMGREVENLWDQFKGHA